ncbi:MAG TPA: immune inhibitor A, partial [Anaerolineaceae bacterium]|nr:immune inhibitor A [Anaerolineaceae bacterium]
DYIFTDDTDIQLNDWSTDPDENSAHYGASFLYVTYLLDRFGEHTTRQIVADAENGFESIDRAFTANNLVDPLTGEPVTADEFFRDWTIANYLVDNSLYDGRYTYTNYSGVYAANTTDTESICDGTVRNRSVHQYGTDYIELDCPTDHVTFEFNDPEAVQMLPIDNYAGSFAWSNRADSSDTSMQREFDFTDVIGPIEMTYQAWYDLEEDYDFVYLLATIDGQHWQMVNMPSCTSRNLNGNNYGCGYNSSSGGWITESVDLSGFAGQKVTLSFEYITDEAVAGEGLVLDNIKVAAIDYLSDFEQDNGGWELQGFVNITNAIPQTYLVSVFSTNGSAPMQKFEVKDGEGLNLKLDALPAGERYIIAISGTARYTRQEAQYQYNVR